METLTKAELEIMEFVWKLGKASARDIMKVMDDTTVPHSTISSVLRILERKKFLDFESSGRTYIYYPLISKAAYGKKSLKKVLQSFFNDSPKELVSFLVNEKELTEDDVSVLRKQIEQLKKP